MREEELFTKGLNEGYSGGTECQTVYRGPFQLKASSYISPNGDVYRDEWIADRTGGGQELILLASGKKATRLYAGGVIFLEKLAKLRLTKQDVTSKLKRFINEASGRTRLHDDYGPVKDGDWIYRYAILEQYPEVAITVGLESIIFRRQIMFVHGFLLTSVE